MNNKLLAVFVVVFGLVMADPFAAEAENMPVFPGARRVSSNDLMGQAIVSTQKQAAKASAKVEVEAYRLAAGTRQAQVFEYYKKALEKTGWRYDAGASSSEDASWTKSGKTFVVGYLDDPSAKATYIITTLCDAGCG